MGDNSVIDDINIDMTSDDDGDTKTRNTFSESIKELGRALFKEYEDKTSNLSNDNILGMIRIIALNEYMERSYGYRYSSLDVLVKEVNTRRLSHKGFGITKLIEIVKSIQASFEQYELPRMLERYNLRR
jgi:hypothetical protein